MILVYTVSDFKSGAADCIDLMANSLMPDNYEFCVIGNKPPPVNFSYNFILDRSDYEYPGFLKYSNEIPNNYSNYVYLDSDILCFEKPSNLLTNKNFSVVFEENAFGTKPSGWNSNNWHKYEFCSFQDKKSLEKFPPINGGFFSFSNDQLNCIKQTKCLFENYISKTPYKNAMLEQKSLNYGIAKNVDFDVGKIKDFSEFAVMFADNCLKFSGKYIYHFCGFTNEMNSKLKSMKKFLNKFYGLMY